MGTPFWATYYDNATGYGQEPIPSNIGSCLAIGPDKHYYFSSNSCDDDMSPLCEELTGTVDSVGSRTDSCGGSLTAFSGQITSPNYPDGYPVSNCIWSITRGSDSVIRITVTDVDIWCSSSSSSDHYLSIRDGSDINSPELGHFFCHATVVPVELVTTGNQAWVSFQSPVNSGYRGFSLTYTTECKSDWENKCSVDYNSETGSIHSPCYPNLYPSNLDCGWSINVQDGYYIVLSVVTFDTEMDHDIVQIRDGSDENAPVLHEISGFVETAYEITSSSNTVYLSFKSDGSNPGQGFSFVWTSKKLCPAPYLNVGKLCIHIVLYDLTYGMSGIACQEASGELATLNNSQDLRDLYVFLQNQGIADYSFWIGATDEEEEGVWKWKDGTMVPTGTPFWGTTGTLSEVQEPDGGVAENCMLLLSEGMHFFRDASCDTKAPGICMHSSQ